MNSLTLLRAKPAPVFIAFILAYVALSSEAFAACDEGCNTGNNDTFLGDSALSLDLGSGNTAVGAFSMFATTTVNASYNTALGFESLFHDTNGSTNAAIGSFALFNNTTGTGNTALGYTALESNVVSDGNTAVGYAALQNDFHEGGFSNTAVGYYALSENTEGGANVAVGESALVLNTTGGYNTAIGNQAAAQIVGSNNTAIGGQTLGAIQSCTGSNNVAVGYGALGGSFAPDSYNNNTAIGTRAMSLNSTGSNNTANGFETLVGNTTGDNNTANGFDALHVNTTGNSNTAIGNSALLINSTGSSNIAIGDSAGSLLTTGSNNIEIGHDGNAAEANTIRIGKKGVQTKTVIAGIRGTTVAGGIAVYVDGNGRLGTATSSARFKMAIKPMADASEAILALKPVTFRYKKDVDPEAIPQFGLVAEEVAKIDPDLVARDDEGKPYTVRYEAVNAMLLNEFLKEHKKVETLEAKVTKLEATLEKVSAHLETE